MKSAKHKTSSNVSSTKQGQAFFKKGSDGQSLNEQTPFFGSTRSQVQTKPASNESCANYETNEIEKSHTQKGVLNTDTFIPDTMSFVNRQGDLIISDFGVDWGSVKDSTKNDAFLQQWVQVFENNTEYWLEIEGYTDCAGVEQHNSELRQRRATKVYQMLDKAWSRVKSYKAAPANDYLTDNTNMEGRAINRGVAVRFNRIMNFTGETIDVNKPKPPKQKPKKPDQKPDTSDCDSTQIDLLNKSYTLAINMVQAAIGEIENDALLKKYFGKDAPEHRFHIKQNFVAIKNGLKGVPTFECEDADSYFCDGAVAYVIPISGLHIHICPSGLSKGVDYLARTIVHESGHRFAFIFSPDDLCAGGWPSSRGTTDAEDNADCYGEFAGDALNI